MGKFNLATDNQAKETKKEYGNTFQKIFGPCNEKISNQPSKILLIDKKEVCRYLTDSEKEHQSDLTNKETCLQIERPQTVVGFFIRPSSISENSISLMMQSIHVGHTTNGCTEYISDEESISASTIGIINPQTFPFITYNQIPQTGFSHNIFQFHSDAVSKQFMKSFVSWYELKCIVDHCDYLGISGSLTMTGNVGAEEDGQFITGSHNTAYFTYRIIGFKKHVYSPDLPDWVIKKLEQLDTDQVLIKSNFSLKEDGVVQSFDIPTETWAVPCPPMWKPI
jgi:hypothetical protein